VTAGAGPAPVNQSTVGANGRPNERTPQATMQGNQPDSIYVLVEKFDNFGNIDRLVVLPQDYSIEYSVEGSGATFLAKWTVLAEHWMDNGNTDKSFFVAQK